MKILFAINEVRQLSAHPNKEGRACIDEFLGILGVDLAATRSGWGVAVDAMLDQMADAVESITLLLASALD